MTESRSPSRDAQLVALKALFQASGVLHEVHVFNLKIWPKLAFPNATSVATVDTNERRVTFDLKKKWWARFPKDWRVRCQGIHESVQAMLGSDMETHFVLEGRAIFQAERARPVEEPRFEGTDFEAGRIVPATPWKFPPSSK